MNEAKFVTGKLSKHILKMASTSSIGLIAIFFVDLLDLFFIGLLDEIDNVSAVGIAGSIVFLLTSISIGASVSAGALVSKSIGEKDIFKAKHYAINCALVSAGLTLIITVIALLFMEEIVYMLGAKGHVASIALDYLIIVMPSSVLLSLALSSIAILRALGDAKGAMLTTLSGALIHLALDPILIFAMNLGVNGAAIASVFARVTFLVVAVSRIYVKHKLLTTPKISILSRNSPTILNIALPAILTNCATPLGNAFVLYSLAKFGTDYVAGYAVISKIIPVCFAFIFSLSGAVGPILGQNYGAKEWRRIKRAMLDAHKVNLLFCILISIILLMCSNLLIYSFNMSGQAADIIDFFCSFIAFTFIFNGMLFLSNAALNNLGSPKTSSVLNVGKATLGTIPFVIYGGMAWGAPGILIGQALGSAMFGLLGVIIARRLVHRIAFTR